MKNKVINVVIADDHALIREGLKRIISYEEDMSVTAEAENGESVLEMVIINKPDVLLLDVNLPQLNGIGVLQKLKEEGMNVKIIMLTIENQRQIINEAINIGVDGYVLKDSAGEEIIDAIRTVYNGDKYIDKSLVATLFTEVKSKAYIPLSIFDSLSKRELEVLIRISKGFSNKDIGAELFISEKTVKNYATSIFDKIKARDRVQATIISIENQIDVYYDKKYGFQK
jgi:two-component system, NarL family, response regulator DegU